MDWVNQPQSETDIVALSASLAEKQIHYIYVFTTYLQSDGTFNQTYAHAADFLSVFHATNPDAKVLAWIGLPLDDASWGHVDLGRQNVRQQVVDLSRDFIQIGFDGIHLDPEPIHNHNDDVLSLLEAIRPAIPHSAILSNATPRIAPLFPESPVSFNVQAQWTADYYRKIGRRVDQIVVMTYDSLMPTAWLYRHWVEFQVIEVTQALRDTDVEILFGISTSKEETTTHRSRAENMQGGLHGLVNGLNDHGTE